MRGGEAAKGPETFLPRDQAAARDGDDEMEAGSVVRWGLCDLDEMPQDLENLRGVCDNGEHLHGFAATRAG